jgi:hypothetical protein
LSFSLDHIAACMDNTELLRAKIALQERPSLHWPLKWSHLADSRNLNVPHMCWWTFMFVKLSLHSKFSSITWHHFNFNKYAKTYDHCQDICMITLLWQQITILRSSDPYSSITLILLSSCNNWRVVRYILWTFLHEGTKITANGWKYIDELFLKTTQLAFDSYEYGLMNWCLMPTSAVFQLYIGINKFYKFNKLIASTIRYKTYLCRKQSDYMYK